MAVPSDAVRHARTMACGVRQVKGFGASGGRHA